MPHDSKSPRLSRRDLLFGAVKRLKREDEWEEIREQERTKSRRSFELLEEGNKLLSEGDFEAAAQKFRSLLEERPDLEEARRLLGYSLYRIGRYIQARVEFERVLYTGEGDNFSSLYLGLCLARMGMREKAVSAWKGYFNADEIDIQRELNLQAALMETGDAPSAEEMAETVEAVIEKRKQELG